MIEQDTIASVHVVGLAVVDGDPVRVQLGDTIRAARIEWRGFALWGLDDLSVEFGGRGLVEADVFLEADGPDGIEEAQGSERVNVA